MTHPSDPTPAPESQMNLFDEGELDISDYLRDEGDEHSHGHAKRSMSALVLGAVGVVYGDIGTSPIYAFREALHHLQGGDVQRPEILGLLSLLIWSLSLILTIKYVMFLLRVDNRGEGGVLALYTMVRLAIGHRSIPILALAITGASLLFGDAIITPAMSVLSAVEGAKLIVPAMAEWVVPTTLVILFLLFLVQSKGTSKMAAAFGPITVLWFLALAAMGVYHMLENPDVLNSFSPVWGVNFVLGHQNVAFVVMGAIFLAVTGAEALYADLGHFGRKPITIAWVILVFPALILNYLGQGALVLTHPETLENPFYSLVSPAWLPALVILATMATVIAAQAVITGAYSMGRAAIQLGLFPRLTIRHTSANQSGQIYIGAVNWFMMVCVFWLVVVFPSSSQLASAYGIAASGTMLVTTIMAMIYLYKSRVFPIWIAMILAAPIFALEAIFFASNMTKVWDGGYVPLMVASAVGFVMAAWWRGSQAIMTKAHRQQVPLESFVKSMAKTSAHIVPGTAFFLGPDPDVVPTALLHNMKHNRVLHDQNIILTIETLRTPLADAADRVEYQVLGPRFGRLILRFGFMETPNVSRGMASARKAGLKFDVMSSSFFIGRKRPVVKGTFGMKRVLDRIYAVLTRFSADPSDYYHLPRDRVLELGERVVM